MIAFGQVEVMMQLSLPEHGWTWASLFLLPSFHMSDVHVGTSCVEVNVHFTLPNNIILTQHWNKKLCTFYVQKESSRQKQLNDVEAIIILFFFVKQQPEILWNKMKISISRWSCVMTKKLACHSPSNVMKGRRNSQTPQIGWKTFQNSEKLVWLTCHVETITKALKMSFQKLSALNRSCLISCYVIQLGKKMKLWF